MPAESTDLAQRQRQHYETIHDEYDAHYYDPYSLEYRDRFILATLLEDVDLNGKEVLDVACGSGFTTLLLRRRFPRLRAVGLDISARACRAYETNTGFPALRTDLTAPLSWDRQFDCAIVIGGLHHCVANLPQVVANLAAAIRPGGILLMMEPNSDCWMDGLRRAWYRCDRYFDAPTERALSHDQLLRDASRWFAGERIRYIGGPAYFAILNSLVLRIPLRAKRWIAPASFPLEAAFNAIDSRRLSAVFLARWRRLAGAAPPDVHGRAAG